MMAVLRVSGANRDERTGWIDRSGRDAYPAHMRAPDLRAPSLAELAGDVLTAELK